MGGYSFIFVCEEAFPLLALLHPFCSQTYAGLNQNKLFTIRITHGKIVFLILITPSICLETIGGEHERGNASRKQKGENIE